jgi:hypothetical protein
MKEEEDQFNDIGTKKKKKKTTFFFLLLVVVARTRLGRVCTVRCLFLQTLLYSFPKDGPHDVDQPGQKPLVADVGLFFFFS